MIDRQSDRFRVPLTRSHSSGFRTHKRKVVFTQSIIKLWNSLPQDAVMATGIEGFKRGMDNFMEVTEVHQWPLAWPMVAR